MMTRFFLATIATLMLASSGLAQTIDGTLVGDETFYGDRLKPASDTSAASGLQNTDTRFGNANFQNDPVNSGGGSELIQTFGTVSDGRLNVLITGNLESNFNKLVVFIDSGNGGVNTLDGANLPDGFDPFCEGCGGGLDEPFGTNQGGDGGLQNMNGLTFDTGFNAGYALAFTHGNENVNDSTAPTNFWAMSAHYADLTQGTAGQVAAAGIVLAPQGMPNVLRAMGDGLADAPATPDGFDDDGIDTTMFGPALPNLGTGELIDRSYALDPVGGGCTDDTGAGCIATELAFVLDVDPAEIDPNMDMDFSDSNGSDHRNFNNTVGLMAAIDNSNTGGVDELEPGFPDTLATIADREAVVTGVEFSIPLASIGLPTGDIKIAAFVNGGGYDFASNQFIGEGILSDNLGSDGNSMFVDDQLMFDLSTIAGDQFLTIENTFVPTTGDYNGDGVVDAADYTVWRATLGDSVAAGTGADGDMSGTIDEGDFLAWRTAYGNALGSASAAATVPEPASLLLVAMSMAAGLVARRR